MINPHGRQKILKALTAEMIVRCVSTFCCVLLSYEAAVFPYWSMCFILRWKMDFTHILVVFGAFLILGMKMGLFDIPFSRSSFIDVHHNFWPFCVLRFAQTSHSHIALHEPLTSFSRSNDVAVVLKKRRDREFGYQWKLKTRGTQFYINSCCHIANCLQCMHIFIGK